VQLERISLALRPRTGHECLDLAAAMLRSWGGAIFAAWSVLVLPVCLLFLLAVERAWLALFLLWMLRPLFELVPVFVASRAAFGAVPSLQVTLRDLPRSLWRLALVCVVRYRWMPWRALVTPAALLEGSTGRKRAVRERELRRSGSGDAVLAACCFLALEVGLFVQGVLLLWFFTPGELAPDLAPFEAGDFGEVRLGWFAVGMKLVWLASYSVCGVLHALAGFALYLNQRSRLEGWDVELAFRRLGARAAQVLRRVPVVAVLAFALLVTLARSQETTERTPESSREPAAVAPSRQDAAEIAREVLAHADFDTTETRTRFRFPRAGGRGDNGALDLDVLAYVLQFLGWALLVALLVGVVVMILRMAGLIEWRVASRPKLAPPRTHVFGLDVRPESLPEDIGARARELWLAGDAAGAMGLLYRGALSRLIATGALAPDPGDTERDCVEHVRRLDSVERFGFFASVTSAWLVCAYSRRRPDDATALALCDAWGQHFRREAT